jgi:hypothetical protein
MSTNVLTMVFPDGRTEYRTTATHPSVGDVIRHRGEDLVVEQVEIDYEKGITVTVGSPPVLDA